ncbi:MAG: hypothetical protein IPF74_05840 [Rhodocyclaceae bacterium]|nr:hypothetical protein [Rhodocyclaceae bacterium]MBK6676999.1 hypothetical protein [Rhodocyclaceae bacterium]
MALVYRVASHRFQDYGGIANHERWLAVQQFAESILHLFGGFLVESQLYMILTTVASSFRQ